MRHFYQAHLSDGRSFDVETPHHHDDHTDEVFKSHLLDVIKGSVSGILSGVVLRFIYKGRRG